MQQIPGTRMTLEDKRELERNIKELEKKIESGDYIFPVLMEDDIKELRQLRRRRGE